MRRPIPFKDILTKREALLGTGVMGHKLLIVDDERAITDMLKDVFSREPYDVLSASSAEEALTTLARESIDLVISDEKMAGMSGSEFLAVVRQKYPETIRMILSGRASLQSAIRAINEGEIYRFFTKPCNVFDLAITVRQALQHKDLMRESRRLLKMVQEQSAYIEALEKEYSGITKVKRDARGDVIMDEEMDDGNPKAFIQKINETVRRCETLFREKK